MFRNMLNIANKLEARKEIMETIDLEMVDKLVGTRRPKNYDEKVKKYVSVQ